MQKPLDYFKGTVRAEAEAPYVERFLNYCANRGIEFSDVDIQSPQMVNITLSLRDYKRLKRGLPRMFSVRSLRKRGAPFILFSVRKRVVLFLGMALCFLGVWTSNFFIWQIEISGNEQIPSSQILQKLDALGVGTGSCSLTIDHARLQNEMMLQIPELSYFAVNVRGSRAQVLVRESTEKPELFDKSKPSDLIAARSGVITNVTVLNGRQVCRRGQAVSAGDLLVSGTTESASGEIGYVRSAGRVRAQTFYELSAEMPDRTFQKVYTGSEKRRCSLIVGKRRINLYRNSSNLQSLCDKITEERKIRLFGGAVLPITLVSEVCCEYDLVETELSKKAGAECLRGFLTDQLRASSGQAEVLSAEYIEQNRDGAVKLILRAVCSEDIAKEQMYTDEDPVPDSSGTDLGGN